MPRRKSLNQIIEECLEVVDTKIAHLSDAQQEEILKAVAEGIDERIEISGDCRCPICMERIERIAELAKQTRQH